MGLVAAGVNGIKLGVGDEVVGAEVVPDKGEIFMIATDGKAKRVPVKDFPTQGRYGRGVIAWQLAKGVSLAGTATGKPNHVATVHLRDMAPKSTRLDAAPVRKRSTVRGNAVVDVKAGDAVQAVVMGWEVENFVDVMHEKGEGKDKRKKEGACKIFPEGQRKSLRRHRLRSRRKRHWGSRQPKNSTTKKSISHILYKGEKACGSILFE